MADTEEDFSADGIREFIISRGGRVKNVELVGHFKKYLNDPNKKVENRQLFKDFINAVAVVKVENGKLTFVVKNEKTLVLKKKQQDWSSPKAASPRESSSPGRHSLKKKKPGQAPPPPPQQPSPTPRRTPSPAQRTKAPTTPPPPPPGDSPRPVPKPRKGSKKESNKKASPTPAQKPTISGPVQLQRAASITESTQPVYAELESAFPEDSETPKRRNGVVSNGGQHVSGDDEGGETEVYAGPGAQQQSFVSPKEGERIIDAQSQISSVSNAKSMFQDAVAKQREEAEAMKSPMRTPKKQKSASEDMDGSGTLKGDEFLYATLALEPLEREWMVYASQGNVIAMNNLLSQDSSLWAKKDFITGFTALHWGAKHGKKEMIRMVADRGLDINTKSQGGYTALHIAAQHHRDTIMQYLIQDYYANVDIRDYSGKKAKHYLKKGASAFIQQLLNEPLAASGLATQAVSTLDSKPSTLPTHKRMMAPLAVFNLDIKPSHKRAVGPPVVSMDIKRPYKRAVGSPAVSTSDIKPLHKRAVGPPAVSTMDLKLKKRELKKTDIEVLGPSTFL